MTEPARVRAATMAQAPAIAALEAACLGADAWSEVLVAEGLSGRTESVHFLVLGESVAARVVFGGPVAGYAVVAVAGDIAELQRIAVDPAHRRTGVATALLAEAVRLGRAGGANRLLVEVREDNSPALGFYADAGFVEIDRRARYYSDGASALVLRLPLVKGCG